MSEISIFNIYGSDCFKSIREINILYLTTSGYKFIIIQVRQNIL